MKVNVHSLIGELGMTSADGDKIFEMVRPEILAGRPVELDFTGVRVLATPFFNAAIGRLLQDVELKHLEAVLLHTNLSAVGQSILRRVLKNSEEYYRNPAARRALDAILAEDSDE